MSTWYHKDLGDGIMASLPLAELEDAFDAAWRAAGTPAQMALFGRHVMGDGLHCRMHLYLPPALANLATQLHAQPCDPPQRPGLELLAGDAAAWAALFDEPTT